MFGICFFSFFYQIISKAVIKFWFFFSYVIIISYLGIFAHLITLTGPKNLAMYWECSVFIKIAPILINLTHLNNRSPEFQHYRSIKYTVHWGLYIKALVVIRLSRWGIFSQITAGNRMCSQWDSTCGIMTECCKAHELPWNKHDLYRCDEAMRGADKTKGRRLTFEDQIIIWRMSDMRSLLK